MKQDVNITVDAVSQISNLVCRGMLFFLLAISFSIAGLAVTLFGNYIPDIGEGWSRIMIGFINTFLTVASLVYSSYSFEKLALVYYEAIKER